MLIIETGLFSWQLPKSGSEWRIFNKKFIKLYKNKDWSSVLKVKKAIGKKLLYTTHSPHAYFARIIIAHILYRKKKYKEAVPWFEKALEIRRHKHNLSAYSRCIHNNKQYKQGSNFLRKLCISFPNEKKKIQSQAAAISFYLAITRGDRLYLMGKKQKAYRQYKKAKTFYTLIPVRKKLQKSWEYNVKKVKGGAWLQEYTYNKLYYRPGGYHHRIYMVKTFLNEKIKLSTQQLPLNNPVVYRVAAVVVRKTDLSYIDLKRKKRYEKKMLREEKLQNYKNSWTFVEDTFLFHSRGKFKIKTDWIDLKKAVLTGLKQRVWKGIIPTRHLDPAKIRIPDRDALFEKLANTYDAFVFIWPRGKAARAYGGGFCRLPHSRKRLPVRGCVRSLAANPNTDLHEFLHTLKGSVKYAPVHGPKGKSLTKTRDFKGRDEVDWYCYLIEKVKDWRKAKFLPSPREKRWRLFYKTFRKKYHKQKWNWILQIEGKRGQKILKRKPDHRSYYISVVIAGTLMRNGFYRKALTYYEKAFLNRRHKHNLRRYIICIKKTGFKIRGRKYLRRLIKLFPQEKKKIYSQLSLIK